MTSDLNPAATRLMDEYVAWIFAECLGEDETWALGSAWREAAGSSERAHIAAAIVYRTDALGDGPYRVLGDRGEMADARLRAVADALRLA